MNVRNGDELLALGGKGVCFQRAGVSADAGGYGGVPYLDLDHTGYIAGRVDYVVFPSRDPQFSLDHNKMNYSYGAGS